MYLFLDAVASLALGHDCHSLGRLGRLGRQGRLWRNLRLKSLRSLWSLGSPGSLGSIGSTRSPGNQVLEVFDSLVFKVCASSESCPLPHLETFGLVSFEVLQEGWDNHFLTWWAISLLFYYV